MTVHLSAYYSSNIFGGTNMPRKVNYGVDYDAEYDGWDDYYDYDDDSDIQGGDGEKYKINQAISEPGLWRCSICTFDNIKSASTCDICGVFRDPVANICGNGNTETVADRSQGFGASLLAKSLFASFPRQAPKMDVIFHQENDDFASKGANNFHKIGNILGDYSDFCKAFMFSHCKYNSNIDCFKFDSLSPDDLVSSGKHYNKNILTDNVEQLASSKASSSIPVKKGKIKIQPSTKKLDNSSVSLPKVGQPSQDESNCSLVNADKSDLTGSFNKVNVDVDSGSSKNSINSRKATLNSKYKPEAWMLADQEGTLTQLNLAIVGHVDSGKSTLSGRLLNLLGRISQKEMHKFAKEAKLMGKGSFAYAWALDESAEERERGITMTVAVAYFFSKKYHVVVLDSPGHKDFVPNMISGATQADAAILVIDASIGSFEAGMDSNGGQTREHALLIRSFGVDQVIVAVNKMDVVDYSKERFDSIKLQLGTFLRSCGFKDSLLLWIPFSAMENQNLVTAASDDRLSSWYQGPYLLDAIDSLQPPIRDISKPLLMPICDVIKSHSFGQVAASGKLETGALRCGLKVLVMPSGDLATVRSLERDSQACTIGRAGDNVAVSLQGIDGTRVKSGGVLCHPDFPVAVATRLELKIVMLDVAIPILIGSQVEFHIHHAKEAARVVRILSLLDQKTGKVSKKAPRCLTAKQNALIEVILDGAVCVEEFSHCRVLGRVFLRASGRTIAVGIVTKIIE